MKDNLVDESVGRHVDADPVLGLVWVAGRRLCPPDRDSFRHTDDNSRRSEFVDVTLHAHPFGHHFCQSSACANHAAGVALRQSWLVPPPDEVLKHKPVLQATT